MAQPTRRGPNAASVLERALALHVSVISDCLDKAGLRSNILAPHIRPLDRDTQLAGFATTVLLTEVDTPPEDPRDYYKLELQAVEFLKPGDVVVTSTCHRSYWGELLATASRHRGAHGIVADAYTRDTRRLREMKFPTFVAGIQAQDSLGRLEVIDIDVPVNCGGVNVHPGDLVLGDNDGVAIVPHNQIDPILSLAEEKIRTETKMRTDLSNGRPMSDAFSAYGVL